MDVLNKLYAQIPLVCLSSLLDEKAVYAKWVPYVKHILKFPDSSCIGYMKTAFIFTCNAITR